MDSLKPERAHSGMPQEKVESQNIRAKRNLKRFKVNPSYTQRNQGACTMSEEAEWDYYLVLRAVKFLLLLVNHSYSGQDGL